MNINITIGADPELFLINKATDKVISSIGLIPGVKGDPWKDEAWIKGYGLEIDNILAEFNIPPARTCEQFVNSIIFMKEYIRQFVKKINPDYDILCQASAYVDEDQLQSDEAKLFGCSIDFNAYTEAPNPKPKGETTNLRSTGCHIHIGYPDRNVEKSISLVKYMDAYVGIPSVLIDPDTKRRELYGKAGCYRLTRYGLEYRSLSGYFISSASIIQWTYEATMQAINAFYVGKSLPDPNLIQDCINSGNIELAKQLIKNYNLDYKD